MKINLGNGQDGVIGFMESKKYVITVSYGEYPFGSGGTDKFILSQQKILNKHGYIHFHISPFSKNNKYWNVLINGKFYGIFSTNRFKRLLWKINEEKKLSCIIIHHLLNVNITELKRIIDYCKCKILYYLHDYYTICPGHGLTMENGFFCKASFPNVSKCNGCKYMKISVKLLPLVNNFFDMYKDRLLFISPSDIVKEIWTNLRPEFSNSVIVIYHQVFDGTYEENNELINEEKIKVAFVGYQLPLKGWNQFKTSVSKVKEKDKFKFYQFGWGKDKFDYIDQIVVDFKKDDAAMIKELRKNKIDVAVLWSLWPETYSYTYYESLCANCFIITNNISGNINKQVILRNNGIIVNDLDSIINYQLLKDMINDFRSNGHITPNSLIDSEEFIKYLPNEITNIKKVRFVFDFSCVYSYIKKLKKSKKS